jgi:hypothetical protein
LVHARAGGSLSSLVALKKLKAGEHARRAISKKWLTIFCAAASDLFLLRRSADFRSFLAGQSGLSKGCAD